MLIDMQWEKIEDKYFIVKSKNESFLIRTLPFQIFKLAHPIIRKRILEFINEKELVQNEANGSFSGFFGLDVVITTKCNLRCKYCCALSKKINGFYGLKPENMDINVASKMIDLSLDYFENEIKNKKLSRVRFDLFITGGEPLLNFNVVLFILRTLEKRLSAISKKYNTLVEFSPEIATNGTKMNEKIAKLLKQYNTQVVITLDGHLHDETRIYPDGRGSLSEVLNALKILLKYKNKIKLQTVMPISKINEYNQVIKFYKDLGILKKIKRVHLIPQASQIFDSYLSENKEGLLEENKKLYKKYGLSLYKISKELNLDIKNYQGRLLRSIKIGGLAHRCPAAQWKICVTPAGDIYPCHQLTNIKEFYMGNVKNSRYKLEKKISRIKSIFRKRTVFLVKPCKDCLFQTICIPFVDCPARCFIETGDLYHVPEYYCEIHKPYMEKIFENTILKDRNKLTSS